MTPPERAQLLKELVRNTPLNRFSDPHATSTFTARILDALDERHLLVDAGAPARITKALRAAFTEGLSKDGSGESWGTRALLALFGEPAPTPQELAAFAVYSTHTDSAYTDVATYKRLAPGSFKMLLAAVEAGETLARINTDKGE